MKFYDCETAPSPRRVRIFAAEKGLDLVTQQVDLRNGEQLGDTFRQINPDCTVPVLELDDGTCLTEVIAICQFLESQNPQPPLLGRDDAERARVTMWNAKVEQLGLAATRDIFRNKAKGMSGRALPGPLAFEQIPGLVDRGLRQYDYFMRRLDTQLTGNEFIAGDIVSVADISAFVAIEFAGWSKLHIPDELQHLMRWYRAVRERPAFSV